MTEKNGDLKYKTDNAIDEAYRRGYEDAKKEFIGMSAKQIQIKYHDDFATALEKMYEYEERQTRYDIEKVYDPIEGAERYTFAPKKERQIEKTCDNCLLHGHCQYYGKTLTWLLGDKNKQTGEKVCKSWKPNGDQIQKESE